MIGGGAGHAGPAGAEVGGDNAVAGPAEAAGGEPGGPDLGAPGLDLGHRLGQGHGGHIFPGGLLAVDDGHVGGDVRLAVHAFGQHLGVALVHTGVVPVGDGIGQVPDVVLPLHGHHRQIGYGVGDGQLVPGVEHGDVIAGVQGQKLLVGHAVVLGDGGPHVAGLHGVYHGPLLGGVELLSDIAQVGDQGAVHIALLDLHVFHKAAVHGVLGDIARLHLLQQLIDGSGVGGGGHGLAVYIQGIAIGDVADLVRQVLGELLPALQVPAGDHMGLGGQQGGVDGVVLVL